MACSESSQTACCLCSPAVDSITVGRQVAGTVAANNQYYASRYDDMQQQVLDKPTAWHDE